MEIMNNYALLYGFPFLLAMSCLFPMFNMHSTLQPSDELLPSDQLLYQWPPLNLKMLP